MNLPAKDARGRRPSSSGPRPSICETNPILVLIAKGLASRVLKGTHIDFGAVTADMRKELPGWPVRLYNIEQR